MDTPSLPETLHRYQVAELLHMPAARVLRLARAGLLPCRVLPDGNLLFLGHELAALIAGLAPCSKAMEQN